MKDKETAAFLALFFGAIGAHRFYLGRIIQGLLHLLLLLLTVSWVSFPPSPGWFLLIIPLMIGALDAVFLFSMPQEEFDKYYNKVFYQSYSGHGYSPETEYLDPYKKKKLALMFEQKAMEQFRDLNFQGAAQDLDAALQYDFQNPDLHFYRACCFSMEKNANDGFFHLEKAVEFGWQDFKKIHTFGALAFLRNQNKFERFVESGYRLREALPPPQEQIILLQPKSETENLLFQLERLADLKEKGLISEEEFEQEKKKLLKG